MVMLNKLLNLATFALAIATLFFAIKLHEYRTVLKGDRDRLVATMAEVEKATKRNLEIEDYKAEEAQPKIIKAVAETTAQKELLADAVVLVGEAAEVDPEKLTVADLKSTTNETIFNRVQGIVAATKENTDRSNAIARKIQSWGNDLLGTSVNIRSLKANNSYETSLSKVEDAIIDMKSRGNYFVKTLKSCMDNVEGYEWSFSPEELDLVTEYKGASEKMLQDMKNISKKLKTVTDLQETIQMKDLEIENRDKEIATRNEELASLKKLKAETDEKLKKSQEKLKEYEDNADLDKTVIGKVNWFNKEFGVIETNLGKKQVRIGLEMYVRRGTEYIGTVRIFRLKDKSSMADVLTSGVDIQPGDSIIFK